MSKSTYYIIIGIGFISIATGIYSAFRTGDFWDSFSGMMIGSALVGIAIFERNKK